MAEPLHVLMISPQFRPMMGGYEQAAERLSLELCSRGHRVTVVSERRDPAWPREENLAGVRIRRLLSLARPGLHTLSGICSLLLYLLLRGRRFDVFHVHQYGWASTLAILLGRVLGRPVILKLTNTGDQGIRASLDRLPLAGLHRAIHRHLSGCIATSTRARDEIVDLGLPASRIRLIPNGLDTQTFQPASATTREHARRELGIPADARLAITVCRMRPEKGLPGLLDAWARVHGRVPNARLAIVGDGVDDGAQMANLQNRAARLELGASLALPGASLDPRPWYAAADLYVLSSINEGLSNSLMEALSCGLPVVSTRVSGSEDILEASDVGLLVPVGDAEALAKALTEVLGDSGDRRARGERASAYAEAHFSLVSVADEVEAFYSDVCRS
ncbi:MAG: glycosyltransferase family 4 protein [Myxococcota bacterium]|nr:glycosyltransferase family 4 protein [Myxococcota bacterium]